MIRRPFSVRVPASTSNLGSGFDTLSAALSLYLTLRVEPTRGKEIEWVQGVEPTSMFPEGDNLICKSMHSTFALLGSKPPGLRISIDSPIPLQRGLGSSAAAIIGGIKTVESLCCVALGTEQIFEVAYPLEGHPDNLAASLLGGWVLSWVSGRRMQAERLPSALSCRFVLCIPEVTISTREARAILPKSYSLQDATYNLQRCALLVHALHTGQKKLLQEATSDRLHQPFRSQLVSGIKQLLSLENLSQDLSGSLLGISISGSGSAVIALADNHYDEIGRWMVDTLSAQGTAATYRILDLDTAGAQVIPEG
ncbi:homoserine kinase [Acidobacteria bacterium AH-259-L09]|nr:homoserine kinase [Acidobacteria bacterium AH-259-L09]